MIVMRKKALFKIYGYYLFIDSLTLALEQLKEKLRLNTKNAFDAIVVARGGGSMEDLYYKRKRSKNFWQKLL